jgi:FKBP-type peptidyl-prolyl cis-trans isomerase SlyD
MIPHEGVFLQLKNREGKQFVARIAKVEPDSVLLDFNNPLAGKTLNYKVKVISIE